MSYGPHKWWLNRFSDITRYAPMDVYLAFLKILRNALSFARNDFYHLYMVNITVTILSILLKSIYLSFLFYLLFNSFFARWSSFVK